MPEQTNNKFITEDGLVAALNSFGNDVLLPAMQAMSDENNQHTDKKIAELRQEMNERFEKVDKRFETVDERFQKSFNIFATKEDLKRFATKDDLAEVKSEILTAIDGLTKNYRDVKDDQTANLGAHYRFEERLEKMESKNLKFAPSVG